MPSTYYTDWMTRAEVEVSARKGNKQARTIAPLHPGETFRFPAAVRAVAASHGLHTAAECAQEWARTRRPLHMDDAMKFVRVCVSARPTSVVADIAPWRPAK